MAVGIGKNVQKETLRQIAGGGSVVEVDDFDKLKGTIEEIKSKACSGEVTWRKENDYSQLDINCLRLETFLVEYRK